MVSIFSIVTGMNEYATIVINYPMVDIHGYTYIAIGTYVSVCVCIYIYIQRPRRRKEETQGTTATTTTKNAINPCGLSHSGDAKRGLFIIFIDYCG